MSKYTVELHTMVEDWGYNIWNFPFTLNNLTTEEIERLKELFMQKYYFREIGLETPKLFMKYFQNKWNMLCLKYDKLFGIYKDNFAGNDLYSNNTANSESEAKFLDTPQSQMVTPEEPGYLTNMTKAKGTSSGLINKSKYEIQRDYADKLRFIMFEMIDECETLFMQLID